MEQPVWYRLLYYWCYEKVPVGSGLTIPFLVGAELFANEQQRKLSIPELISEFRFHKSNKVISIRYCLNIGEYIVSLDEMCENEKSHFLHFGNFYIVEEKLATLNDYQNILDVLENRYLDMISHGKFSKDYGKWKSFSDTDVHTINRVLY